MHICTHFPLLLFHLSPLGSERRSDCLSLMYHPIYIRRAYPSCQYIPQLESNYPSGKIFLSPISSPPCSAFSFRFCVTSQLYTLAVATSSVCNINPGQQSTLREHTVQPLNVENHRDLFPQKIQVFLTRLQAALRNTKLRL